MKFNLIFNLHQSMVCLSVSNNRCPKILKLHITFSEFHNFLRALLSSLPAETWAVHQRRRHLHAASCSWSAISPPAVQCGHSVSICRTSGLSTTKAFGTSPSPSSGAAAPITPTSASWERWMVSSSSAGQPATLVLDQFLSVCR